MAPSDPASPHPAGSSQEFSIPQTGVRLPVESSLAVLQDQPMDKGEGFMLPFDPWRAADALWKSRWLALLCGSLFAIGLFFAARKLVEPHYIATAQLVRQGIPDTFRASQTGETYKPNEIPIPVLTSSIIRSRSLMERVGKLTTPEMDPRTILSGMDVVTDRKTEVIRASFTSAISPARAVAIVNNFADEVVKLTKELQAEDASQVNDFLKQQLTRCDIDLDRVNEEMLRYAKLSDLLDGDKELDAYLSERANFDLKYEAMRLDHETLDLKIQSVERELAKVSPIAAKLQKAREELTQLLTRYTEHNPVVEEQQDRIKNLEAELKRDDVPHEAAPPQAGENPIAGSLYLQAVDFDAHHRGIGGIADRHAGV